MNGLIAGRHMPNLNHTCEPETLTETLKKFLAGLHVRTYTPSANMDIALGAADPSVILQGDGRRCRENEEHGAADEGDPGARLPEPRHAGLPVRALAER